MTQKNHEKLSHGLVNANLWRFMDKIEMLPAL